MSDRWLKRFVLPVPPVPPVSPVPLLPAAHPVHPAHPVYVVQPALPVRPVRRTAALAMALATALVMLLSASGKAGAQNFISMGRLFTTPSERAQLDQARSSGAGLQNGPAGSLAAGAGAAGAPGGGPAIAPMTGAAGSIAATGCTPAGGTGGNPGGSAATIDCASADGMAPSLEAVRLTGMIRRSNGKSTVFVNNEAQEGHLADHGRAARVNVDGRSVVLKPGQSFDPATGAINEAER